jgi:glycosyltransferase involved in cell wall biosynthesis
MTCVFDNRWIGEYGIGRFALEVKNRLIVTNFDGYCRPMSPFDPFLQSLLFVKYNSNTWFLSPGYNAPLFSKIPYILTIHDINHIDRPENSSFLKRLYYSTVLKRLCKNSRAILTVSNYSKDRISDWFYISKDKIFNVGNGVSEIFYQSEKKSRNNDDYVLCVSNRRGHKNEKSVLVSFAKSLLPPTFKLVLTGSRTSELHNLAQSLGISERIIFTGRISELELADLYSGAFLLLFPSFYEGFGLPIAEAFASGTPVITSNVTSMPEIAGDAALLVNPNAIDEIISAINQLYESPQLRTTLIERGRDRAKSFSWDAVAEKVRAAVHSVDNDPHHPLNWT